MTMNEKTGWSTQKTRHIFSVLMKKGDVQTCVLFEKKANSINEELTTIGSSINSRMNAIEDYYNVGIKEYADLLSKEFHLKNDPILFEMDGLIREVERLSKLVDNDKRIMESHLREHEKLCQEKINSHSEKMRFCFDRCHMHMGKKFEEWAETLL